MPTKLYIFLLSMLSVCPIMAVCAPVQPKTDLATAEKNLFFLIDSMTNLNGEEREHAVKRYVEEISVDSVYFNDIVNIADMALADPESDRYDDELLISFMQNFVASPLIGEVEKERALWRIEAAVKNRPGTKASDFNMSIRDGRDVDLWSIPTSRKTVVLFYDPDCDHCSEVIGEMKSSCADQMYDIIAVDISGDKDLWMNTRHRIPQSWISAFAINDLEDEEIYIFNKMPTIFILNPDKTVVSKNAKSL